MKAGERTVRVPEGKIIVTLTCFHFHWIEEVDFGDSGDEVGVKFNGVVIGMMGRKLVMGFLREDICKVLAPFGYDWFCHLSGLSNLGGDGGFTN